MMALSLAACGSSNSGAPAGRDPGGRLRKTEGRTMKVLNPEGARR